MESPLFEFQFTSVQNTTSTTYILCHSDIARVGKYSPEAQSPKVAPFKQLFFCLFKLQFLFEISHILCFDVKHKIKFHNEFNYLLCVIETFIIYIFKHTETLEPGYGPATINKHSTT